MLLTLTPKNFRDIGTMVYRTCPEIAARCIRMINKTKPDFQDTSLISQLFTLFCEHNQMNSLTYQALRKTENVYLRMVFIAIIIKLYNPELLTSYSSSRMKKELRKEPANLLKTHPTWVSQKVKIVCFHLEIYEQFAEDVSDAIFVLKSKLNKPVIA